MDNENNVVETPANEGGKGAFVLGIISLVVWLLPLVGYPVSIIGLVLGIKGAKESSKAKSGMIMSIIGLVLTLANSILGVMMETGII